MIESADGGRTGSLLHEIDRTVTSMGGRLLRTWLLQAAAVARAHPGPARRRRGVRVSQHRAGEGAATRCSSVHDMERLVARAALGTAGPRDLVALRQSLAAVPRVRLLRQRAAGAAHRQPGGRSSTILPICGDAARVARSSTSRRRWRATAARFATASTPSSTSSATSAARASAASPRWRKRSARGPGSTR